MFTVITPMIGCDGRSQKQIEIERQRARARRVADDLYTVEHDGHMFVVYKNIAGYAGAGGLEHHPDCPCKD